MINNAYTGQETYSIGGCSLQHVFSAVINWPSNIYSLYLSRGQCIYHLVTYPFTSIL